MKTLPFQDRFQVEKTMQNNLQNGYDKFYFESNYKKIIFV